MVQKEHAPGRAVVRDLAGVRADVVSVFVKPEEQPPLLPALAVVDAPVIWFQSGFMHREVAAALEVAGKVVGAPAKVNITVTTAQGKTLNSVALDGTDSFALKVPVSTTLAKVMASLPNGRSVSADCFQGCDAITLRFE